MAIVRFAGLAACAALGAQAQVNTLPFAHPFEPLVVTASRTPTDPLPTLREAVVITREDLDAAGPVSLAEALQRFAGVEIRTTGGPGQPASLFLRGTGNAQTLVLIDGLRAGSGSSGGTALEAIPLEMIERIEVVKGPLSSLYGSDAIGGVVQVFTRGRGVPHLFASAGYGSDNDRRASAGVSSVDGNTAFSLNAGGRKVDARSATNPRAGFFYDPDRDPHEEAFANGRLSHKAWNGEELVLDAFATRSRTSYDGGSPDDRAIQEITGVRVSSSTEFMPWWRLRLDAGHAEDRYRSEGGYASRYDTKRDQGTFVNELGVAGGKALLGAELVRERVTGTDQIAGPLFPATRRDTKGYFASIVQAQGENRFEGNVRHDQDDFYGGHTTGSASLGFLLMSGVRASATYAQGFRAPTFNDVYGYPGFSIGNDKLRPEKSRNREASLRDAGTLPFQWRATAFDNRLDDLIVPRALGDGTYQATNVARARVRGLELEGAATWYGVRLQARFTAQRARDEDTGLRLQGRADRFGSLEAARTFGRWTVGANVLASGARNDATPPTDAARVGGYARVDARVRYTAAKFWNVELTAVNVADRRYENAAGFDAPRRGVFLNVRFDAF